MCKWALLLVAGVLILGWSIHRDIRYSQDYPGDLRYRIVGARLVSDGHSPYRYKWKPGDGFRYYDPDNFDNLKAANITVSPFYLHLLKPLSNYQQSTIIWIWLVSEYLLLAGMTVYGWRLARTDSQRLAVVAFALLFLLTNAWKRHVFTGQTYLWIPALAMLFYAGISRPGKAVSWLVAGVAGAVLLFMRINTVFFFLPFLAILPRFKRSWLLAGMVPALLLAGWVLLDHQERGLWQDYGWMSRQYLLLNQGLGPQLQNNAPDPRFALWEGIDKPRVDSLTETDPNPTYSENGNVFVLLRLIGVHLPWPVLSAAAVCLMALLFGWFWFRERPLRNVRVHRLAVLAFCLYMISDLFSPIHRHQYYEVQWLFPLFLVAAGWQRRYLPACAAILAGLLLGSCHLSFLRMQNTIGEYLILASLLALSLLPERVWPRNPTPTSPPVAA